MDILSTYQKEDVPYVRVSAPMVRYSKLPFRLLVREYGVDLAYSPMIMADSFVQSPKARDVEFTTCPEDRPLIVQLASKDPCEFALATKMLAPYCDGIDLNCGCPQKWALNEGLGASLLRKPEQIAEMIHAARDSVPRWRNYESDENCAENMGAPAKIPTDIDPWLRSIKRQTGPFSISAKIRICKPTCRAQGDDSHTNPVNLTVELVNRLAKMGVDWIVLHGRTVDQRSSDVASWNIIKELVDARIKHLDQGTCLPIILNGDVRTHQDADCAYATTGCHELFATTMRIYSQDKLLEKLRDLYGTRMDNGYLMEFHTLHLCELNSTDVIWNIGISGVMVARGLLKNPQLFAVEHHCPQSKKTLLDRWLDLSTRYPGGNSFQNVHQQAYWMLESQLDRTRRLMLHSVGSFSGLVDWLDNYWCSFSTK